MALSEHQPGARAPHAGCYEQLNVLGARNGVVTYAQEGDELPDAPYGFTWTPLVMRSAAELREEGAEYRRLAETALVTPVMIALYEIADRFDALAQRQEREDAQVPPPSSSVDALITGINQATAMQPRPLDLAIATIKLAIATDVDAYLLVGSLIEGIGAAIAAQIPPERQGEVAVEAVRLLRDRMRRYNVI
jgi:hypothetical protein